MSTLITPQTVIKHLVISGGGVTLIQVIAAFQELEKHNYISMDNIKSIYSVSAGTMAGVCMSLGYDWSTLNDYIINRPWGSTINTSKTFVQKIASIYSTNGILSAETFTTVFEPLFSGKSIPIGVTLEELFAHSNIEQHFFTFNVNKMSLEDFSYKTHPNVRVIDAVFMSCNIPVMFSPCFIEGSCYVDGGLMCNYPSKFCADNVENIDEIMGFKTVYSDDDSYLDDDINETTGAIEYLSKFVKKLFGKFGKYIADIPLNNEMYLETTRMSMEILANVANSRDSRKSLFDKGTMTATNYLTSVREQQSVDKIDEIQPHSNYPMDNINRESKVTDAVTGAVTEYDSEYPYGY